MTRYSILTPSDIMTLLRVILVVVVVWIVFWLLGKAFRVLTLPIRIMMFFTVCIAVFYYISI